MKTKSYELDVAEAFSEQGAIFPIHERSDWVAATWPWDNSKINTINSDFGENIDLYHPTFLYQQRVNHNAIQIILGTPLDHS